MPFTIHRFSTVRTQNGNGNFPVTPTVYQNDHQPSLIQMVVLKVKDTVSRETEGRVQTDDLEKALVSSILQAYYIVKIPYSCDSTYTICDRVREKRSYYVIFSPFFGGISQF